MENATEKNKPTPGQLVARALAAARAEGAMGFGVVGQVIRVDQYTQRAERGGGIVYVAEIAYDLGNKIELHFADPTTRPPLHAEGGFALTNIKSYQGRVSADCVAAFGS